MKCMRCSAWTAALLRGYVNYALKMVINLYPWDRSFVIAEHSIDPIWKCIRLHVQFVHLTKPMDIIEDSSFSELLR